MWVGVRSSMATAQVGFNQDIFALQEGRKAVEVEGKPSRGF